MSLVVYLVAFIIRCGMTIVAAPLALLGAMLSLPLLAQLWGAFVWFTTLLGDAGDLLLGGVRTFLAVVVAYLPLYVGRRFAFRKTSPPSKVV